VGRFWRKCSLAEYQPGDIQLVNEKAGFLRPALSSPNSGDSYFMNQSDKRNDKPNEAPYKRRVPFGLSLEYHYYHQQYEVCN